MDYVYLFAVIIGGILVNCGVMLIVDILEMRLLGMLSVGLGVALLTVTISSLQDPLNESRAASVGGENEVNVRTPIVDGLTVRVGPGRDYESASAIWQVNRGDKLRVVEDTLGWIRFRVKYFDPDWSGWVAKDYTTVWETYQEIRRIEQMSDEQNRPVLGE